MGLFKKKSVFDLEERERALQDRDKVDFNKIIQDLQKLAQSHALPEEELEKLNHKLLELRELHMDNVKIENQLIKLVDVVQNKRMDIGAGKDRLKLLTREKENVEGQVKNKIRDILAHINLIKRKLKKKEFKREARDLLKDMLKDYVVLEEQDITDKKLARKA